MCLLLFVFLLEIMLSPHNQVNEDRGEADETNKASKPQLAPSFPMRETTPMNNVSKSPSKVHTVNVFSADNMWNPQFFVAPDSAIDSFNKHFQLFQYYSSDNNPASFQHEYWRTLDRPPMVMMPPTTSQPALIPQALSHPTSPINMLLPMYLASEKDPTVATNDGYVQAQTPLKRPPSDVKRDEDGNVIYDDELQTPQPSMQRMTNQTNHGQQNSSNSASAQERFEVKNSARSFPISDTTPTVRGLMANMSDYFGQPIPLSAMNDLPFVLSTPKKKHSQPPSPHLTTYRQAQQLTETEIKRG